MSKAKLERLFLRVHDRARDTARYWLRKHMAEFAPAGGENSLILDVGAGKSPYKAYFRYQHYITMDADPNCGPDIITDIRDLPFADGVADVVICTQVLEHVRDSHKALSELKRVLKEEGYLILSVPFLIRVHDPRADFFRWTEQGLKLLVEDCGLEVIKMEKAGGIFSCLGHTTVEMLFQVFGPYKKNTRNWVKYGFLFYFYLVLIPVTKFLILLDAFDTQRDFTLAYSVLAKKC